MRQTLGGWRRNIAGNWANRPTAKSLATAEGSLPVDYQLYLPKQWASDRKRRRVAGVPDIVQFATKPQIALAQIRQAQQSGLCAGIVLADAAYGTDTAFRDELSSLRSCLVRQNRPNMVTMICVTPINPLFQRLRVARSR